MSLNYAHGLNQFLAFWKKCGISQMQFNSSLLSEVSCRLSLSQAHGGASIPAVAFSGAHLHLPTGTLHLLWVWFSIIEAQPRKWRGWVRDCSWVLGVQRPVERETL